MTYPKLRPYDHSDAPWVVQTHTRLYARDEGFNAEFQSVVEHALAAFEVDHAAGTAAGWIAERGGRPVGCIFCGTVEPGVAKIRMFLLIPQERGKGSGREMLQHAMHYAQATGHNMLKIWTYAEHQAACRLYGRMGLTRVGSAHTQAFGRDLTEEVWQTPLPITKPL